MRWVMYVDSVQDIDLRRISGNYPDIITGEINIYGSFV